MSTPRVLIVEDELVVGLDLQHRLAEMSYQVVAVVPTGVEAIAEAARAAPDLVLMDIKLAGEMDGVEAAGRIRAASDTPVVFVTAFADEAMTRRVKTVAPYGYVVKPFQKEALRAVIETALTRHEMERRLQDSERSVREAHARERALRGRLEALDRAGIAVARALTTLGSDVRPFLRAVAEEARSLGDAEHAALAIVAEPGGSIEPCVFAGIDEETARAIGGMPRADGQWPGHPLMTSFLSVPIRYRGETRGSFYLANKRGAAEFTAEDQAALELLAERVGAALEIARLHQLEARERARLELLATAGTTLAGSLDLETTLAAIADLIVSSVGDLCRVGLAADCGGPRTTVVRHVDPAKQAMADRLPCCESIPADVAGALGLRSRVFVPLELRGQTLGFLEVFGGESGRDPNGEMPFIQEIAHLATLSIGNARFHQATEQSEREQRFLADLGTTLASTLDSREILSRAAQLAARDLADFCILDVVEPDGRVRLEVVHADPARASACDALRQIELDPARPHLLSAVLETKQPSLIRDVDRGYLEAIAQSDEHLRLIQEMEPRSIMVLPLAAPGRLVGTILLGSSRPSRHYGPGDLVFAEHVAHRIALAIDHAELYEVARRAVRARDDVLGIVAHDLRNPLNTIVLQLELLRGKVGDSRSLEASVRAATRMNRMIHELLDVARLEAGQFAVDPSPLDAAELVREVVEDHRTLAAQAVLELSTDIAAGVPAIGGDRALLDQVFDNLIGNAIKFTQAGGRVTVGSAPRDREVVFWVADNGVGIPPGDLPHLFDRFWQAARNDRRGAGLGLAIVKGIVEAHGGQVWVESTVGQGTTVFFTISTALCAEHPETAAVYTAGAAPPVG